MSDREIVFVFRKGNIVDLVIHVESGAVGRDRRGQPRERKGGSRRGGGELCIRLVNRCQSRSIHDEAVWLRIVRRVRQVAHPAHYAVGVRNSRNVCKRRYLPFYNRESQTWSGGSSRQQKHGGLRTGVIGSLVVFNEQIRNRQFWFAGERPHHGELDLRAIAVGLLISTGACWARDDGPVGVSVEDIVDSLIHPIPAGYCGGKIVFKCTI